MPVYQTFNKKIGAWVKYKFEGDGVKFFDVKEKKPKQPFKGVKKK